MRKFVKYDYYFSLGCFRLVSEISELSESGKRQYISNGIIRYNKYVKKSLNLKMRHFEQILSNFLTNSPDEMKNTAQESVTGLEDQHELSFLHYAESKINNKNNSDFLEIDHFKDKLKEGLTFIIPTISAVIAIVSLFSN